MVKRESKNRIPVVKKKNSVKKSSKVVVPKYSPMRESKIINKFRMPDPIHMKRMKKSKSYFLTKAGAIKKLSPKRMMLPPK